MSHVKKTESRRVDMRLEDREHVERASECVFSNLNVLPWCCLESAQTWPRRVCESSGCYLLLFLSLQNSSGSSSTFQRSPWTRCLPRPTACSSLRMHTSFRSCLWSSADITPVGFITCLSHSHQFRCSPGFCRAILTEKAIKIKKDHIFFTKIKKLEKTSTRSVFLLLGSDKTMNIFFSFN